MPDIESLLNRWLSEGILDSDTVARIRAHEAEAAAVQNTAAQPQPHAAAIGWQTGTVLILGVILLVCGVALFVSAHWNELGPWVRLVLVLVVVAAFHLAAGFARLRFRSFSTALHAAGTLSVGPAIALVGQTFNLQSHWPASVLLWALAAVAGWILLRDQAQQTLALLLIPAWLACELTYYADGFIGAEIYYGRFFFTWAVLYLTFFAGSRRKAVQGILFAAAAIAAVTGTVLMLSAWASYTSTQIFLPFSTRFWAWAAIAALPLIVAAFHGHKGLIPIAAAVVYALLLPWCYHMWIEKYTYPVQTGNAVNTPPTTAVGAIAHTDPTFLAHLLVAAFTVFLCAWGVRIASRALVNFGIVGFAAAVTWFYFSNIFTALGRSIGLTGLGILFLAGGWGLEKMRRRILDHMSTKQLSAEAQ